ncbi:DUF1697 domain-containing protein [Streptomyces sp. Da 82-17]|uniref:DUF1697 domain-containing protein n=1 Tax=Streptomyces sp. Da 82-17 TaxID=3377116 RepID=UPI0038D35956
MTMYAALLRGINVGGHKKVPMAELRTLLTDLGFGDVRTHLQSGNAVFSSDHGDEESLAADISAALASHFGFDVDVLVRDGAYLRAVADACPFPADSLEPKQLHVTYFSEPVRPEQLASVDASAYAPEDYRLGDRALYLYAPEGLGRSKLAVALGRPSLLKGVVATSRNWNTVLKLAELTRA